MEQGTKYTVWMQDGTYVKGILEGFDQVIVELLNTTIDKEDATNKKTIIPWTSISFITEESAPGT